MDHPADSQSPAARRHPYLRPVSQIECAVAERRKRRPKMGEAPPGPLKKTRTDTLVLGDEPHEEADNVFDTVAAEAESATKEAELAKQHLVDFFSQDLQSNPIKARSTYVGSELSNLHYLTRQRSADQHVYHYPCSNIYIPRVLRNSQAPATPNLIAKDAFVLPPTHVSDVLIADYFNHIHTGLPIIDKDKFMKDYHDSDSAPSILLLQAICLAGSHVTTAFKNNQDLKAAFFRRAKALIDGRYEEDRMHVVQAALLLTWFSDGGDDICANAWWWIGVAARTAIGLGMHRDVGSSKMPETDKCIWRKIWWCLIQLDCLVSLCYGRPQHINLDDCDVPPLGAKDFEASASQDQKNFVMEHARLCAIVSDFVRSHFSLKAKRSGVSRRDALEKVDDALAQWFGNLPPGMRELPTQTTSDSRPLPCLLHLTYNMVLIQFHRPQLVDEHHNHSVGKEADAEICADAASNIIRIFQQLRSHASLRCCWFWAPSAIFTAMLQINRELKCQNSILALRAKDKFESGLQSLRKLARYWLFAVSILRLFQTSSNGNKQAYGTPASGQKPAAAGETFSLDEASTISTVSPKEVIASNTVQAVRSDPHQYQTEEMGWVQPPSFADLSTTNMNLEENRWQTHLDDWQSLYWSDPLANISLDDSFGTFQFEGF
ncbi:hypothetical protein LTR99_002549 [Exophiala xenobiotica]|uniref:Xylanolytic transcriptional activator regulatory domain-containing protein n=1 Tax=Vermiconidia calcicola TaxID=1690605 RepID=A0AAV9QG11_9PEZI|nr:hypothetical protein LTR96_002789 [Exophiala xenobiotica]KAK5537179.1 hypothetical protein LTR23_007567 [Chaetothyriales sp. CCFEE 6169]KAK5542113.1 hypothetical protein LTR25_001998 [Vermiconidia calcicola]KAK5306857.1 hypothetical protein LTR99_002549 [Exophiala xenobiotica]KAK5341166.1 hypothetical protein LTR98_001958 [Exophiala xenobiotica]